ncbi:unknown [Segatella copri CAG:164]|nr:unknown [Segatella copri CAG:164]
MNIFITFAMQKRKSRQAPNHIPVKSGEEWVKSEQKLFTTPNALFISIYKGKVKSEEFQALRCNKKYKE